MLYRSPAWIALAAALPALLAPVPGRAAPADEVASCRAAVDKARAAMTRLPSDDPTRRFVESDLRTALTEMEAGEVEDCPDLVARAHDMIETRPYRLRPGERMHGYGPDSAN